MFEPLEGHEAEVGPLLIRSVHLPCQRPMYCECDGIVTLVGTVPELGLDRWALVGDHAPPPRPPDDIEAEFEDDGDQQLAVKFIAAFGVLWAALDERLLNGHRRLWDAREVQEWLRMEETTCLQMLELRRNVGDRPSAAARAITLMHDYARVTQ